MASMIAPRPMPPKSVKRIWENSEPQSGNTVSGQMERTRKLNGLRATPLKRTSEKMKRRLVEYREAKARWWAARVKIDGGRCQFVEGDFDIRCGKQAMPEPHHRHGRGKFLSETGTFLAVCFMHHDWIENNKREARERGMITYK